MPLSRQERLELLEKRIPKYSSGEMCSCYLLALRAGYIDAPCTLKQQKKAMRKFMRDITRLTLQNPNLVEIDCEIEKTDTIQKLQEFNDFPLPEEKIAPYFCMYEPKTATL